METFEGSPAGQTVELAGPSGRSGHRVGMLALLGALSAFGPLSMDMYLPSTPTIAANLHASQTLVQLTLSGCLAGLAVGQLVAGPLSDGLGRKKPLLAGGGGFAAVSGACAAAPDIGALIALRFLQGMAGATGVVLSLAIVRDLYAGGELARVLGSLMLVFGLSQVLAPVIGGQVLRFTSWRGVFGVLAAIGLVLLAASWFLPETLPPERRTRSRLRPLATDSRALIRARQERRTDPLHLGPAVHRRGRLSPVAAAVQPVLHHQRDRPDVDVAARGAAGQAASGGAGGAD